MVLTTKKEEQLKKMPRIESRIYKSRNGKYIVQRTIISSVKPVAYLQKIIDGDHDVTVTEEDFDDSGFFMQDGERMEAES
ncbi:MAG: hypothetical protein V1743_06465 [Nanoarchaeota archaeon]